MHNTNSDAEFYQNPSPEQSDVEPEKVHGLLTEGTSIRLLRIHKRRGQKHLEGTNVGLVCDLHVASIYNPDGSSRPFNALSYHWGAKKSPKTILCNGKPLSVTSNLYDALLQYSRRSVAEDIWIDALCIDQSNVRERNHQVSLMAEIYENARCVIIWLGLPTYDFEATRVWRWFRSSENDDSIDEHMASELHLLLNKSWFGRKWTFQEILLAQRAIIWYDLYYMDWTRFIEKCGRFSDFLLKNQLSEYAQAAISSVRRLQELKDEHRNSKLSLSSVLLETWKRGGIDHRDTVYSVLGLFSNTLVEVDYSLSPADVYISAARACILQDRNLSILNLANLNQISFPSQLDMNGTATQDFELPFRPPDWVPHWGSKPTPSLDFMNARSSSCFGSVHFAAADNILVSGSGNELRIPGIAIGYLSPAYYAMSNVRQFTIREFPEHVACYTDQNKSLKEMLEANHDRSLAQERSLRNALSHIPTSKSVSENIKSNRVMEHENEKSPLHPKYFRPFGKEIVEEFLPRLNRASGDWICALSGGTSFAILRPSAVFPGFSFVGLTRSISPANQSDRIDERLFELLQITPDPQQPYFRGKSSDRPLFRSMKFIIT